MGRARFKAGSKAPLLSMLALLFVRREGVLAFRGGMARSVSASHWAAAKRPAGQQGGTTGPSRRRPRAGSDLGARRRRGKYSGPERGIGKGPKEGQDVDAWDTWEFGTWYKKPHEVALLNKQGDNLPGGSVMTNKWLGEPHSESTMELVERAIEVLSGHVSKERLARLTTVLGNRTHHARFMFENPSNPNNVWACLRTLDSFGIQHVHVVADPEQYKRSGKLQTMVVAMGSQKWLSIHGHDTSTEAVKALKAEGFRVLASDVRPGAQVIDAVDLSAESAPPTVLVIGNEEEGISDEMRELADGTFYLPMVGMAESFNMSVATSITLAYLQAKGGLPRGTLPLQEKRVLMMQWLLASVKAGLPILRRNGIDLPPEVDPSSRDNTTKQHQVAGYRTTK